jgi:hypothetical protein
MMKWTFEDSNSQWRDYLIPGAYYCPDLHCWLLSPQHWAQTRDNNLPKKGGTIFETINNSHHNMMVTMVFQLNHTAGCKL